MELRSISHRYICVWLCHLSHRWYTVRDKTCDPTWTLVLSIPWTRVSLMLDHFFLFICPVKKFLSFYSLSIFEIHYLWVTYRWDLILWSLLRIFVLCGFDSRFFSSVRLKFPFPYCLSPWSTSFLGFRLVQPTRESLLDFPSVHDLYVSKPSFRTQDQNKTHLTFRWPSKPPNPPSSQSHNV